MHKRSFLSFDKQRTIFMAHFFQSFGISNHIFNHQSFQASGIVFNHQSFQASGIVSGIMEKEQEGMIYLKQEKKT